MAGYVGNVPVPQSVREDQSFTATAGQTTFNTLGYTDGTRIKVTLNGVLLEGGGVDYTATNGSDVVLTVAAAADDILRFETFNEVQLVSSTSTTPTFKTSATLKNDTEEDTDGGRESTLIFQGEQSGGEISTLAEIEASHDGTADDEKGDLIFRTNDGSDGTSPTERMRIDSAGAVTFTSDDTSDQFVIQNNDAGSGSAPDMVLYRNSASPADGDTIGRVDYRGEDDNGTARDYVTLYSKISDASTGTPAGSFHIQTRNGTNQTDRLVVDGSGNVGIGTTSIDVSTQAGGSGYKALQIESDEGGQINFDHNDAGTGSTLGQLNFQRAGEVVAEMEGVTDGATDSGRLVFRTQPNGGALTERMRIDHDGYVTMPQTPMFSYLGSKTHTHSTGDLVWSTANVWSSAVNHSMNNGSHFNPANGRFTAPITGLYHFQIQAQVYGGSSGYFWSYLDYNQNVRSYVQISQGNYFWLATHHIYINLNANDFVNASSTNNYSGWEIRYPAFSGALVG